MVRGEKKSGYERSSRRMVRSKDKGSDASDEDYMLSEGDEIDESEDEYSLTCDGDESDETFGELEEEEEEDEEEEFVEKKVKKVGRPKVKKASHARGRKRNESVKPKRKRLSYREDDEDDEDDDDDDDDADYNFDGEEINKVAKPRKKTRVSYREEDDDYDCADHDFDDEKMYELAKPGKKKRVSYKEEEECDDYDGTADKLDDVNVNVVKPREKKRVSYIEEDDDYDVTDDKFNNEKGHEVAEPRKKKEVSYREDDDYDYDVTDDEFGDEKVNGIAQLRGKRKVSYREEDEYDVTDDKFESHKVAKPRKKQEVSYREEEDDDFSGADDKTGDKKVNKVVKLRGKRRVYRDDDYDLTDDKFGDEKVSKVAKPRKKKEVSYVEEDDDYAGMDYNDDDDDGDYDGTEDDDYDEEFTPDEFDGIDDEDELLVTKKIGRPPLQEKGIIRRQKWKKNSKVLKKTMRKKRTTNSRPSRKAKTGNDGELADTKPIIEETHKKVNGRRRRGRTVNSDSDFVYSGSPDYEYTISEEEREQIQEANEFCRSLKASLRNSISSKNLEEENEMLAQKKRPARKGKEKVVDLKVEAGKQVCGICLTEEGKRTVRGTLNCCSHYFCFACIMEWSKVESRCPLCKQRFVTISKPARLNTGFDLRTVVIQIPERDQVYQPSEEELQGFLDPYDNVICTECDQGGDDALMLLCDLCDSPAHTYCVGLGHEVPEGNWYCEGCRPAALASSDPQVLTPTPELRTTSNLSIRSSPVSSVRQTFDLNEMYVPDTPMSQETSQLPSPRPPSIGDVQLPSPASGSGAFTVLERRRIYHQVHQILNNRRREMEDRIPETPTTISGHSLFGSQVGRTRELASQLLVAPERISSNNIHFHRSLLDNTVPLLQNYNVPSPRVNHIEGQPNQNQPSTSSSRSFSGYMQNEFAGSNISIGLRLGHQQLQPCSGISNIGSDASSSSYPFREATVPSRTLQEAQRTQF